MLTLITAVVGATGGIALVLLLTGSIWCCMKHCKKLSFRSSETGSSDPCPLVEWNKGGASSSVEGSQGARQFTLEELDQATRHFSEDNVIGEGTFGMVYKGFLHDGTLVAIKQRKGSPKQEFEEEVHRLSEIRHRNLVTLLGYCQENGLQMLVFEHLPNDNMCSHLHNIENDPGSYLDFKQRLSVALSAARGLSHLHGLTPPLVHKDFKTSNVLVDENYIAKVADVGLIKLLERIQNGGSSTHFITNNVFLDPGVAESGVLSQASDVYSFGVFLLELITGQETAQLSPSDYSDSLTQWVESRLQPSNLVDRRLIGTFTPNGMKGLVELTLLCLNRTVEKRPDMEAVVSKLDQILEKERALTTVTGEGTETVTLGSQLFTSG